MKILLTFFIVSNIVIILAATSFLVYYQQQLPKVDAYAHETIPQDTRIYDRNNVLLYDAYAHNQSSSGRRISVTLPEVPKVMQDAMVATEDRTFWTNGGINVSSTLRATLSQDGGASTITQQVIKNLSHNDIHTVQRKLQEAVLAIGLTQRYTKAQILAMYFNIASFGSFDTGIESAVEAYFHLQSVCTGSGKCTPAVERLEYNSQGKLDPVLGLARASLLAGMPNSPGIIDPTLGTQAKQMALARQKIVLQAMISQHMSVDGQVITPTLAKQAENVMANTVFEPYQHTKLAPHFIDWVLNQIALQLGKGDYATGLNLFEQGGLTIRTTLDSNLEEYVERAVDQHLNKPDYQYYPLSLRGDQILSKTLNIHSGAVVVMDAKTGEVLAMDGSADYFSANPAVGGQYNMAAPPAGTPKHPSGRPPGTTMLPIDYMATYGQQFSSTVATSKFPPVFPMNQRTSANSLGAKLATYIGSDGMRTTAQNLGITVPDNAGVPFALGTENVPLLQMTGAYQVLADNGQHVPPVGILDIYDQAGHNLYHYNTGQPPVTQVVPAQVTDLITSGLINEPGRQDTFGDDHQLSFADQDPTCATTPACKYQVAAQASDTNATEDGNTTIGYTPDVVVGVWVGNTNGKRMNSSVVGSTGAVSIWHSVIERALGWCGTETTASSYFQSDDIPCGPSPHTGFSTHPTRTFSAGLLSMIPTPTPTPTPPPLTPTVQGALSTTGAQASYLLDGNTGSILKNVNGQQSLPMASTTKMMTALIALQSVNLNQVVTIRQDAVSEVNSHQGSSAQLVVGDTITLHDLLYGLMLPSGDDAAIAIADAVAGSQANFVVQMNKYAQSLHLTQMYYVNSDGLTYTSAKGTLAYNTTSAADLIQLTQVAMKNPLFAQIVQSKEYKVLPTANHHAYDWLNTNQLLTTYPGTIGVKTGFTAEAGYCLVFAAVRNGHYLIGTVLHDSTDGQRFIDAANLLDWGFAHL
ncbi:MAG: transglycosylase domain-containing protein [Ktedonobacteraceae bacterium]|nr:transglycosylase domain-containing protein [Ktedonobacteraceae bacterium]